VSIEAEQLPADGRGATGAQARQRQGDTMRHFIELACATALVLAFGSAQATGRKADGLTPMEKMRSVERALRASGQKSMRFNNAYSARLGADDSVVVTEKLGGQRARTRSVTFRGSPDNALDKVVVKTGSGTRELEGNAALTYALDSSMMSWSLHAKNQGRQLSSDWIKLSKQTRRNLARTAPQENDAPVE
jgi:hypothetical protein